MGTDSADNIVMRALKIMGLDSEEAEERWQLHEEIEEEKVLCKESEERRRRARLVDAELDVLLEAQANRISDKKAAAVKHAPGDRSNGDLKRKRELLPSWERGHSEGRMRLQGAERQLHDGYPMEHRTADYNAEYGLRPSDSSRERERFDHLEVLRTRVERSRPQTDASSWRLPRREQPPSPVMGQRYDAVSGYGYHSGDFATTAQPPSSTLPLCNGVLNSRGECSRSVTDQSHRGEFSRGIPSQITPLQQASSEFLKARLGIVSREAVQINDELAKRNCFQSGLDEFLAEEAAKATGATRTIPAPLMSQDA